MNNENINENLNNMILQTYFLRSNSLKAATQYTTWFIFPRAALLRSPAVLFTYPPPLLQVLLRSNIENYHVIN